MTHINTLDPLLERRDLDNNIDKWFDDRGITLHGSPMGQAIKTLEETTELLEALNKGSEEETIDAIGDIYVTLRGVCQTAGLNFTYCVEQAYNEIKDRKGTLGPDGIFRKDDHPNQAYMELYVDDEGEAHAG